MALSSELLATRFPNPIPEGAKLRTAAVVGTCAALTVALYVIAVRTGVGQHADQSPVSRFHLERTPSDLVIPMDIVLVLVTGSLAPLVLWLGRRQRALLGRLIVAGGTALLLAEGLRRVIGRPTLHGQDTLYGASFPSGHATAVMSVALGLLLVAGRSFWTRLAATFTTAGVAMLLIAFPVHRPSDILAGFAIAFAFITAAAGSVGAKVARTRTANPEPWAWRRALRNVLLAVARCVVVLAVMLAGEAQVLKHGGLGYSDLGPTFIGTLVALTALAELVIATFVWLNRADGESARSALQVGLDDAAVTGRSAAVRVHQ